MIQINLLPVRTKKKSRDTSRHFIPIYLTGVVLLIVVVCYFWVTQNSEISALNEKSQKLDKEIAAFAKYETILRSLTQRKEVLEKKSKIIGDLQKDRDSVVRILAMLSINVPPEKLWLDKMNQAGNVMTLHGMALSNEAVAEFLKNLELSPYVEKGSVNLAHSKQTVQKNMKLREFQVTYRFYPFSQVQKLLEKKAS